MDDSWQEVRGWRRLWARNMAAARANLVPGLVLQLLALMVLASYYLYSPAAAMFVEIAEFKVRFGYVYSGIATMIFGGVIPFLVLYFLRQVPSGLVGVSALFYSLFWLWRGVEVDAFYRLQAEMWGDEVSVGVVVRKVLFDQFVYCVVWASPVGAIAYSWRDHRFSWRAFRAATTWRDFVTEILCFQVATWIVWVPATAIIYSLPSALQIPLFNLVLCFFVLIVSVLGKTRDVA